jgi:hypothetical protein
VLDEIHLVDGTVRGDQLRCLIGSIDDVVLFGPPHSVSSFLQRIGRGGRRGGESRVLCLGRTPREALRFAALLEAARAEDLGAGPPYHFKPSVLVQPARAGAPSAPLRFRTAPYAVGFDLTQAVAAHLGLGPGRLAVVPEGTGCWLFHFWGDVWGTLLAALLEDHRPGEEPGGRAEGPGMTGEHPGGPVEPVNELCLWLPFELLALPAWDGRLAEAVARGLAVSLEPHLELGRFHALLPPALRLATVIDHCDLPRLAALWQAATLVEAQGGLRDTLLALV